MNTSLSMGDVRDCLVGLHENMMQYSETKNEIVGTSSVVQDLYSPYYVVRVTPPGTGAHVEVHIQGLGQTMYAHGAKRCVDKLPPA